jgi:DNA-binding NtrC family response regulator
MRLPASHNLGENLGTPRLSNSDVSDQLPPVQPAPAEPVATTTASCSGARVLLVCQDHRSREQFQRVAEETRASVVFADSTEAALRLLARQPIDVAVIDTSLRSGAGGGGSNGDLLESIRGHWSWIQLILLGNIGDEQPSRAAVRFGVSESLTKPCSQREIVAALTRASRRRAQDSGTIPAAHSPTTTMSPTITPIAPTPDATTVTNVIDGTLEYVERVHILAALQRHHGNRELAAQALGISVRKLYYRLRQYAREGHVVR